MWAAQGIAWAGDAKGTLKKSGGFSTDGVGSESENARALGSFDQVEADFEDCAERAGMHANSATTSYG
jgi:hypothetical protein